MLIFYLNITLDSTLSVDNISNTWVMRKLKNREYKLCLEHYGSNNNKKGNTEIKTFEYARSKVKAPQKWSSGLSQFQTFKLWDVKSISQCLSLGLWCLPTVLGIPFLTEFCHSKFCLCCHMIFSLCVSVSILHLLYDRLYRTQIMLIEYDIILT